MNSQVKHMPMRGFAYGWTGFRVVYTIGLALVAAVGFYEFESVGLERVFWIALAAFALEPLVMPALSYWLKPVERALAISWYFLPVDVVALGAMTMVLEPFEDPLYPLFVGLALFYAAVAQRRWIAWVALVIGLVYLGGHATHWLFMGGNPVFWGFSVAKAATIPLLGVFMGTWMERRIEREGEMERRGDEVAKLNEELTRRLAELHIVSEITEVIHSTLDFDSIGHIVLESLKAAIDMPTCSLMVVDRKTDETVFSANAGDEGLCVEPPITGYFPAPESLLEAEDAGPMFTCTNLLEHNEMGVVFCCPADRLDTLSDDDMLVLQAVASELVVAVENSRLYQLTKRLSITDELTGLNNYRFLQQRLDQEYERANRYNRYLSMLMLDIDHFKEYNDRHGHIVGDLALADLAGILQAAVREVDIAARYGGEEFAVILPETDAAGAFVVAEKIREIVSEHKFPSTDGDRNEHMTVSVGVATFPVHALDREGLLRQADDALYQAKHFGRDRVRAPRISSEATGA